MWRNVEPASDERRLGGVERAGACRSSKTSLAPGQLCCRNEGTMNGFLCVTMTAALSSEGTVRGPCYGHTAPNVCACVYAETLLRNVRIHAKHKELESQSRPSASVEISQSHQKAWPESHTGWN